MSELASRISENILSGVYPPGSRLRQEALAAEFQVSRTPIREALNQLEAKGLVVQRKRQGAIVASPSVRDVRENYQVRSEVEGLAAELAATWITDGQLQRLRQIHEQFQNAVLELNRYADTENRERSADEGSAEALSKWIQTNSEFHALIYEASNNACLLRIIRELHLGYTRNILTTTAMGMYKHRMEQNITHHAEVLQALMRRDPEAARAAMRKHILESGDFVVAWLEAHAEPRLK
ncbi:GntR family transcriptional regulator [Xanthomonas axonopodis]|uniref:GntR family transcriptional regulator n=1 Tax=Xanthomonas axonopodis TaxID=53413 RepID=UPI0035575CC0